MLFNFSHSQVLAHDSRSSFKRHGKEPDRTKVVAPTLSQRLLEDNLGVES